MLRERADEALAQKALDLSVKAAGFLSTELIPEAPTNALSAGDRAFPSVTEHTTHQLKTGP
jgi:hypothetical protein